MLGVLAVPAHAQDVPPAPASTITDQTQSGADSTDPSSSEQPSNPTPTTTTATPAPTAAPTPATTATPAATGTPAAAASAATTDQIAAAAQPSVVHIVTDATLGSGVKIADGILTSAHVVQDTATIEIYSADHRHAHATLVRIDPTADIALLQTDLQLPSLDLEPVAG